MEFVGCCGCGDWVGSLGGSMGWAVLEAFAGYVAGVEEGCRRSRLRHVFDVGVFDVCERDAFGAGAGDVGESQAVEGFVRVDGGAVDEDGDVVDFDVGEAEVLDGRDAIVAGDGIFAHEAGVEDVEAEEAATLEETSRLLQEMSSMKAPRPGRDLM